MLIANIQQIFTTVMLISIFVKSIGCNRIIVGSVFFSNACEGPPGIVHGGAISSALDDVLGCQVWRYVGYARRGIPTKNLTVRFLKHIQLSKLFQVQAKVTAVKGHLVHVSGAIHDIDTGVVHAKADGIFSMPRIEHEGDIIPYEEAIQRFGRLAPKENQLSAVAEFYAKNRSNL